MQSKARNQIFDRSASLHLRRPWPLPFMALMLTALLGLTGCSEKVEPAAETTAAPRPVRVAVARQSESATDIRIPGVLRARQRATLAFLNDGYLADRQVELGERVSAGTTLAMLYNPALQPGLAAAEADVRAARTRLQQLEIDTRRQAALVERELVSDDALEQTRTSRDAARATLEQAEARLDEARAQFEDAALRAPFDGSIVDFMVEPGDFARAGQPVIAIADDTRLEVRVHIPQSRAGSIAAGQAVDILLQDSGRTLSGQIRERGLAAPGSPVPVVVDPAEDASSDLYPGQPVYLQFSLPVSNKVRIPLNAVIDPGTGAARVFVVRDGHAEQVGVELGRLDAGQVEFFGPIQAGEPVVVAGQANLLDGEAVRVID